MFTCNNLKGPTYLHCIYVVALVVMSIILRHKNCIFLSTCCVKHWGFNSQQERMVPDNTALTASTEDKQAVPMKGDKHREARSTACNGNTPEEQSQPVRQELQPAHSVPTPTPGDATTTSRVQ